MNRTCKIVLAVLLAGQNFLASAQTNAVAAPADVSGELLKGILKNNIFDPARIPNVPFTPRIIRPYVAPVVRLTETFSLVGIIGYDEGVLAGSYAVFDGTYPQYQKTAQMNDTIATFKITGISADSVTLTTATNGPIIMRIGEQLHYDGIGHWLPANGITTRYNNTAGFGRTANRDALGNGNGNRRRNNINGNNFNRVRNNSGGGAAAGDQNFNFQNNAAPDDNAAPDVAPPDNSVPQQFDQSPAPAPAGDANDPLAALKAARAAELQQIGR
jgi:hypothetical protein